MGAYHTYVYSGFSLKRKKVSGTYTMVALARYSTVHKSKDRNSNTFLLYTFVRREEQGALLKYSSNGTSIVLQVDFSENATVATQKELQAAHWHHLSSPLMSGSIMILISDVVQEN